MCRPRGNSGLGTTRRERRKTIVNVKPHTVKRSGLAGIPEWIVVDFDRRGFHCERCGASEQHSTPRGVSRLDSFALRGEAFAIDHQNCKQEPAHAE